MSIDFPKVSCFGSGYVGVPTMAVLALYNPQIKFYIYDINSVLINKWKTGLPIFEPGLLQLLEKTRNINLFFTSDVDEAMQDSSLIYIAVPTPTKKYGTGYGKGYDLSCIESVIRTITKFYQNQQPVHEIVIVQKSTVPIKTHLLIKEILKNSLKCHNKFVVVSNPEFLAEGTSISNLQNPDRIIFGCSRLDVIDKLSKLHNYVDSNKIIKTQTITAELSKLVANCFLAQRISSINSISLICQKVGGDISELKKCIGADSRIGYQFLNASVGFGGSCFKKDVKALVYMAECEGLDEVAFYWNQVIEMNEYRKLRFFHIIYEAMYRNLKDKILTILGLSFKKNTDDLRESASIKICSLLLEQGAILKIYDPLADRIKFIDEMKYEELWKEDFKDRITVYNHSEECFVDSNAIIILTEWDAFKSLDYKSIYSCMAHPTFIFDGRNILDQNLVEQFGYLYYKIGKKKQI